jgi:2',3'-cyclic-nucleotide 2'-phosphodiesterase (5'-nucleotidase family)
MGLANVGGLRNNMPEGIVRRGDIMLISPFENYLVVLEMKGSDLLELMRNIAAVKGEAVSSSVRMEITADGQLLSCTIGGKEIDPERTYTVATIDYLAEGNDKMYALKKAVKRHDIGLLARDAMMEYVIKHRIIDSKMEGRIVVK